MLGLVVGRELAKFLTFDTAVSAARALGMGFIWRK